MAVNNDAGRIMPLPKGEYNASTAYEILDIVSYGNDLFMAKQSTTGNLPTNTTYWVKLIDGNAIFTGTSAEWTALSTAEKAKYEIVNITDDSLAGMLSPTTPVNTGASSPVDLEDYIESVAGGQEVKVFSVKNEDASNSVTLTWVDENSDIILDPYHGSFVIFTASATGHVGNTKKYQPNSISFSVGSEMMDEFNDDSFYQYYVTLVEEKQKVYDLSGNYVTDINFVMKLKTMTETISGIDYHGFQLLCEATYANNEDPYVYGSICATVFPNLSITQIPIKEWD